MAGVSEYLNQLTQGAGSRTVGAELRKQAIDQPLHWAWTFASVVAPFASAALNAPALMLVGTIAVSVANLAIIAVREKLQWPSSRWWDPPLDWAVFALGLRDGLVTGILLVTLT